ncbi:hypothetical protein CK203_009285 [Vitis vinifera]|uniref:Uncharacterized protein n=1 Tax=Vitis vinifera TaxID=29760 RepID=A0A438K2H5_VITVI|nr:hypothetical protein CK203_009285 [Vitis vinifera]
MSLMEVVVVVLLLLLKMVILMLVLLRLSWHVGGWVGRSWVMRQKLLQSMMLWVKHRTMNAICGQLLLIFMRMKMFGFDGSPSFQFGIKIVSLERLSW